MFADLHLHTYFSDGTYSPEEMVAEGRRTGLGALALTDHDTIEGCERAAAACAAANIEFIAGTELTAEQNDHELHILGYYLDTKNPELLSEMERFQQVRQNRIREMVSRLNEANIPITEEAVFKLANCRSPGRPHVARALVKAGLCGSLDEAFERFLKKNRPAWVPKAKMSAAEAIRLIHGAGGVAVMAHPGLSHNDERRNPAGVDSFANGSGRDRAREGCRQAFTPGAINLVDTATKAFIQGRHFLGEVIERAPFDILALGDFLFHGLTEEPLQITDGIDRFRQGTKPGLLHPGMDQLIHHGITELIFVLEMVKERAFGRAGRVDDLVQAPALKSVAMEFLKG